MFIKSDHLLGQKAAETQAGCLRQPGASKGLPEEVDLNSQDVEQHRPKAGA